MQITFTTHPPGGAAALLATTIPAVFNTGWCVTSFPFPSARTFRLESHLPSSLTCRFYVADILICSLVVLGWALIINNVGERRYPRQFYVSAQMFKLHLLTHLLLL